MRQARAALPGVTTRTITDDDADENHGVRLVQAGDPRLQSLFGDRAARGQSFLAASGKAGYCKCTACDVRQMT